ncbi:MAG: hypothetical protein WDO17_25990 [Alphaproteobacteria bacterium]
MTQRGVRTTVALITLVGHFVVFAFGLFALGLMGPLFGSDVLQTVLMATPVLGVIAMAGLKYILASETEQPEGERVGQAFAAVVILFPTALILCILVVFLAAYFQVNHFGPEQLRIYIGFIETFFGVYVGAISDHLFGPLDRKRGAVRAKRQPA